MLILECVKSRETIKRNRTGVTGRDQGAVAGHDQRTFATRDLYRGPRRVF